MHIGIVFNPRSGSRAGIQLRRMIDAAIVERGHLPRFIDVARGTRLEDRLHAEVDRIDAVAVIGGDGTLNGAVNGILTSSRPGLPVAFLPAGRGKDTARSVPSYSPEILGRARIDWSFTRTIDVGVAATEDGQQRYFVNVSNIGLSARGSALAMRIPRQLGSFAYTLAAVGAFTISRAGRAVITLDDSQVIEMDNLLTLAACNGRAFGGGIYIAPGAAIDDGLLQLVAVRNANVLDLVRNLPRLKSGRPFEHPALLRWNARSIRVEQTSLSPMDLDGEMWGSGAVTWSVMPSALTWIGPRT